MKLLAAIFTIVLVSGVTPLSASGQTTFQSPESHQPLVEKVEPASITANQLQELRVDNAFLGKELRDLRTMLKQDINRLDGRITSHKRMHSNDLLNLSRKIDETENTNRELKSLIDASVAKLRKADGQQAAELAKSRNQTRQAATKQKLTNNRSQQDFRGDLDNIIEYDLQRMEAATLLINRFLLATILVAAGAIIASRRKKDVTQASLPKRDASTASSGDVEKTTPAPRNNEIDSVEILPDQDLINHYFPDLTHLSAPSWTTGSACIKGNVRKENQDYAVAFQTNDVQFGFVADGVGSLDYGRAASFFAVAAAVKSTASVLKKQKSLTSETVAIALQLAMQAALAALAQAAVRYGLQNKPCLRTTLILGAGTDTEWMICHCGDGGAKRITQSGGIDSLLSPQRDDQEHPELLTSSLGPLPQGSPATHSVFREPGDILTLGSDGLWDRVPEAFPEQLLRAAFANDGNLDSAAEEVLAQMASHKDSQGYVFDDNISLVFLAGGKPPTLTDDLRTRLGLTGK